ncbi:hypothetical protein ACYFX5_16575 [Bremerella sp. T1]|uniref:hypothetical protein n=1 Tax=Bremerella sp. TYQ1 TaxID=3119568 RepID=UPI001CCDA18C|nr:hypothetical protein [Bremerella volcania]UBM34674.1 hypothetical protein LA756_18525 [Bremerella volcania]
MASQSKNAGYLLAVVIAALAVWGIYLAIGSYLGLADGTRGFDIRRGLIVIACMGGFLLFWGALLWNRQRRLRSDDE